MFNFECVCRVLVCLSMKTKKKNASTSRYVCSNMYQQYHIDVVTNFLTRVVAVLKHEYDRAHNSISMSAEMLHHLGTSQMNYFDCERRVSIKYWMRIITCLIKIASFI